jgi:hypothetical protein
MTEMPQLPAPEISLCDRCDYLCDEGVSRAGFTADQMRAYGEACAALALAIAGYELWQLCGDAEFARFSADGIQRLKVGAPVAVLLKKPK